MFRDRTYHHFEKKADFFEYMALIPDTLFEWAGYHHTPHTMRYAIGIFCIMAPLWTTFFMCCLMSNSEYSEPGEEEKFLERFRKS